MTQPRTENDRRALLSIVMTMILFAGCAPTTTIPVTSLEPPESRHNEAPRPPSPLEQLTAAFFEAWALEMELINRTADRDESEPIEVRDSLRRALAAAKSVELQTRGLGGEEAERILSESVAAARRTLECTGPCL